MRSTPVAGSVDRTPNANAHELEESSSEEGSVTDLIVTEDAGENGDDVSFVDGSTTGSAGTGMGILDELAWIQWSYKDVGVDHPMQLPPPYDGPEGIHSGIVFDSVLDCVAAVGGLTYEFVKD